jgi:uncharacterized membrane protein
MNVMLATTLVQATEAAPKPSTIVQALLLGILIVFVFSVITAGFTAKRINNIHNPTYSKAFGATLLKNLFGWTAFALFAAYFQAPLIVTVIVVFALVPIAIYRFVFSCMWREAALIWLTAFIVEVIVGYVLTVIGIVELARVTGQA